MNTSPTQVDPELINQTHTKDSRVSMILFLDFDGVLHPYPLHVDDQYAEQFQNTPLLWALLRQHPDLRIVVSSSWRERFPLSDLTDFLTFGGGEDLADRVIGTTPVLNHVERDRECIAWLETNGYINTAWLAVDDQPGLFQRHREVLFHVNSKHGLRDFDISQLSSQITMAVGSEEHVRT